jgi:hypothetical protein
VLPRIREAYYALLEGRRPEVIEFDAGNGVRRKVQYGKTDIARCAPSFRASKASADGPAVCAAASACARRVLMPGQLLRLSEAAQHAAPHPSWPRRRSSWRAPAASARCSRRRRDRMGRMPTASSVLAPRRRSAMSRMADGVAIIPVLDTLVNRGAWLDSRSGLTSYEGIAAQLRAAGSDPEVRSVLLDISSPGGEAAGMAGLADLIRSVRQTKPVTAFVNDMAASAAYGIASAANEIVISPTSTVGSIGVVMLHADRSGELAAQG